MKVLILRFSAIGDIVLTTPIVRAIKTQIPDCDLHYATKKSYESILSSNPHIDKIHLLKDSFNDFVSELKAEKFDFIVDLHNNLRTFRIKKHLRSASEAFPKMNFEKWLVVNTSINKLPNEHIVDRYFKATKKLNISNDNEGLEFFLDAKDKVDLSSYIQTNKKSVSVAVGAKFNTKQIPTTLFTKILSNVKSPIFLLGGAEDFSKAEEIKNVLKENKNIYNFCGKLSIGESASVIKQTDLIITGDTGLMHIASAFQTAIISIWGNTIPAFGMYPYRPNNKDSYTIYEVSDLKCRPCSKIGYKKCPKKHFKCMVDQDVKGIKNKLHKVLKS